MGLDGAQEKTVQLVVRGMRRPAQLEEPKQSLGHTGHWRADLGEGEGVSGSRPARRERARLVCALKLLTNQQTGGDSVVRGHDL